MAQTDQDVEIHPMMEEVLKPLLYADIFDYPLTFKEIHRFLEFKASPDTVRMLLDEAVQTQRITLVGQYYCFTDKTHLPALRQKRQQASRRLWPKALHYGRWIASLPFVRQVSITGSLAVNNPRDDGDDIDFFIITAPNRLWLCRALMILMVRLGRKRGVHLCPNYLLTENVMVFHENNLYIARELLQMVPIYGKDAYLKIRAENDWVTTYLPQAEDPNLDKLNDTLSQAQTLLKQVSEFLLRGPVGNLAEKYLRRWQMNKHLKLAAQYGALDKVTFTADECKGHYDGHGQKTLTAYRNRVNQQGLTHNGKLQ
jgi:hypothetical protein